MSLVIQPVELREEKKDIGVSTQYLNFYISLSEN
jgi:hypothetical protein